MKISPEESYISVCLVMECWYFFLFSITENAQNNLKVNLVEVTLNNEELMRIQTTNIKRS